MKSFVGAPDCDKHIYVGTMYVTKFCFEWELNQKTQQLFTVTTTVTDYKSCSKQKDESSKFFLKAKRIFWFPIRINHS